MWTMFDKLCLGAMRDGRKTVTRRIARFSKKGNLINPCFLDKEYSVKIDRTKNCYGTVKPISIKLQTIKEFLETFNDKEAYLEGFDSKEAYLEYFESLHTAKVWENQDLLIWRIEFEYFDE